MNLRLKNKNYLGFTLIEVLVVTVILSTVGVMVVQLFLFSLSGGKKSAVMERVKENGDYALTIMERMIQSSRGIQCNPASVITTNPDGNQTTFTCLGTRLASSSATATYYLTSDDVAVFSSSCPVIFDCQDSVHKIGINFTIAQKDSAARNDETAQMDFNTTVTLRNY